MKIEDARIGMYVEYMNGKHNMFGDIVQIGNAWRETKEQCRQPYDMIYIQPREYPAPGGMLGDHANKFEPYEDKCDKCVLMIAHRKLMEICI